MRVSPTSVFTSTFAPCSHTSGESPMGTAAHRLSSLLSGRHLHSDPLCLTWEGNDADTAIVTQAHTQHSRLS